jgi:hypothetical protein
MIEIWQPRWHDRTVLIAKRKVKDGVNKIVFTKTPELKGKVFEMDGSAIRQYHIESNGKIPCYAVPLDIILDI